MSQLKNNKDCGNWVVVTNFSISPDISNRLPLEIDMLLLGDKGVHVIEIKHWDSIYLSDKGNIETIRNEAIKLQKKAKIVAGKIRKVRCGKDVGFIAGKFLLTKGQKENFNGKKIEGIELFGVSEWKDMLELNNSISLTVDEIRCLCDNLIPGSNIVLSSKIRNFQNFINLELISSKEDKFRRVFKGLRTPGREKVILALYDLTAINDKGAFSCAEREFKVFHKLQKSDYIPRNMDGFQEAKNYPGELYFFSYIDHESPSLAIRAKDTSWSIEERIYTAHYCFKALKDFHENQDEPVLHRNLTPETIKVRANNKPLFTQFQCAKITDNTTISGLIAPEYKDIGDFIAPEVLPRGIMACTKSSDIYSLCASIKIIFKEKEEEPTVKKVLNILSFGLNSDPSKRPSIENILEEFKKLYEKPLPENSSINVEYWDKDIIKELNGEYYRIVNRLGSGGVGYTFKVVQLDPHDISKEKEGYYVAKVITNEAVAKQAIEAYSIVRPYTGVNYLATVYQVRTDWKKNEITALLNWIEGEPLSEWKVLLPLYLDDMDDNLQEDFLLRWIKNLCEGLSELHKVNLVHGDVTPKNIIVNNEKITLTDYDLCSKAGTKILGRTTMYCSSNVDSCLTVNLSDDIFSLAASIFDAVFNRSPFDFNGIRDKNKGMNWEGIDKETYPRFTKFLEKSTHPDTEKRYVSAVEALEDIKCFLETSLHHKSIYKEDVEIYEKIHNEPLCLDNREQLFKLKEEAEKAYNLCKEIEPIVNLEIWECVFTKIWFKNLEYKENIDIYFKTLQEYTSISHNIGSGYKIERWLKNKNIDEKFKNAKKEFEELLGVM